MNQIRLSELLPGKALKWPEFFVRNIPNTRLESRVIPESQCFRYLHKKGILKVFTTVNQRVLGSSRADLSGKQFHYFMVYDKISPDGAFNSAKAKDLISML